MNHISSFFKRIFPAPRRPLTWTSGLPLAIFAIVFALFALSILPLPRIFLTNQTFWANGIQLGSFGFSWDLKWPTWEWIWDLDYVRPWMFLLLIVTPWIWWMQAAGHSGLAKGRGEFAAFVRLIITGLLIMVIAEPRAVQTSSVISVVYNVDVSDSVNDARKLALDVVADSAAKKPTTDEAGLVVFGRTPAVEYPPRTSFPFEKFLNSQVRADATNLQQTLSLSAAMLPEENNGRIVLISDGTETIGELQKAVTELKARDIPVDVLPIDVKEIKDEVFLERLDLPRFVKEGETYEAATVLTAMNAGSGKLVLSQNGEDLYEMDVDYQAGKNRFAIPIRVDQPGYYEYEARIEVPADKDYRSENNAVRNYLYIDGPGKILLVRDPIGDDLEYQFVEKALKEAGRNVRVLGATDLPQDPLSLMEYDAIIFANVPADTLFATQVQAVHDAVRDLGIGFLMLGGPNSFGPGGYQNSPIEDALPISMEISKRKILPKGALVVILHTCEFANGNSWAKRITKEAIKVLNSQDDVGAIGYGMNGNEWIFELTPAADYDSLVPKINAAQIGDMPEFTGTMQMGLKALEESDAASRHMIIISDGDPPMPPPQLLKAFKKSEVTISTVCVFPHDPRDAQVLNAISSQTGGRFYFPSDPSLLPSIFIKEAKTLRRSQLQKRTFVPKLLNDDSMLRDLTAVPQLHGYVLTSEKEDPRATILLSAPLEENELNESDVDPILAVWRYGLGTTAAWTSDLTDDWGRDWVNWKQFQQFVSQMVTRIARVKPQQNLRVYTYVNGNEGTVVVEDFHPEESLLDIQVNVTDGDDFQFSQQVQQIAPRRYQINVPLQGKARYQVQVNAVGTNRKETAYGGFIVSYSPEYLRFQSNPIVLQEIAEQTGGVTLDADLTPEELTQQIYGNRKEKRATRPVFDWFLMALACMIPLDVAIRRVQLDFSWVKKMFQSGSKESTATMGSLLERKKAVQSSLTSASKQATERPMTSRPVTVPKSARKPVPKKTSEDATTNKPEAQPQTDDNSTTSRLLAMKRKRDQDE
ncbi:MAG: VWA domain-containing protein [Fuerstiella sp.]